MKYSVEVTKKGYIETLEIYGAVYQKRWIKQIGGASCNDKEFWEQLKDAGVTDEEVLYAIEDEIDNDFFASDVARIAEESEQYVPDTDVGKINEWIPCGERLPETNKPVLCWVKSTTIASGETFIIGSCERGFWFLQTYEIGHHHFPVKDYEVVAWCKLPEPYQKGE